ncbi:hypothetical protein [Psychroserpens jangbogonensis]|uniref:hypothetical protein n=1 Tax=Psychroserpens jangbogonensis TaxID=1484460 RepID=UPI00068D1EDF|nr:hypothetical protein [Psychroserpens jangbogonensis]
MKKNDDFYVPYIDGSLGSKTKQVIKRFAISSIALIVVSALLFSFSQKPFKNSTFELLSETKITGTFHENPYPMLRVEVAKNTYKTILLLGFGKSSANPFLERIQNEVKDLNGKTLSIEGNLIYYNGKTLIQITNDEKVILEEGIKQKPISKVAISKMTLRGEIIDPKCYFGVMKPGKGKIHRSCAVRCISGGIPPVLATTDNNNISQYYLITDLKGNPINQDILPFIGKPSEITGTVEKMEDWFLLKIKVSDILELNETSSIY